ncbi:MAG: class A beta-lactamase-related serine hydrolase, partial [Muribaculaceae bacterium]|nr:class A beta-lactamase-related serine hydrolase [Muribaculaceae bacterium]
AILTDCRDTVTVNNTDKYPLMSVFKLHQAISLCHLFEQNGISLDTVVNIKRHQLNPDTWSPMLKDFSQNPISISVRDLLRYTLMQSDNNASNYMFENIESVNDADKFIATLIPHDSFKLKVTEAQMWDNHALCYENHSSPLGAALLINRLFTDSVIGKENRDFICTTLKECKTGTDRIVAPLKDKTGVTIAHKTGSGFRDDNGILSAHNDVGFIELPDGRHYTLAVLVKDFNGNETEAAKCIADISATVYYILTDKIYR